MLLHKGGVAAPAAVETAGDDNIDMETGEIF